jgi:hypothetical protein
VAKRCRSFAERAKKIALDNLAKHCNLPRHARQLLPHDLTHRRAVAFFSLARRELSAAQRMDLDDGPANAPAYAQRPDTLRQLRACKFCKLIKTLDQVRPSARFGVDGAPAGRARAQPPIATGSRDFRPDFFPRSPPPAFVVRARAVHRGLLRELLGGLGRWHTRQQPRARPPPRRSDREHDV